MSKWEWPFICDEDSEFPKVRNLWPVYFHSSASMSTPNSSMPASCFLAETSLIHDISVWYDTLEIRSLLNWQMVVISADYVKSHRLIHSTASSFPNSCVLGKSHEAWKEDHISNFLLEQFYFEELHLPTSTKTNNFRYSSQFVILGRLITILLANDRTPL